MTFDTEIIGKYADLLVNYCLELKEGERLFISSSTLAEQLVREVYREAIKNGALVEVDLAFEDRESILLQYGNKQQLRHFSPIYKQAIRQFDAYLNIRAPFLKQEKFDIDPKKAAIRRNADKPMNKIYFERIATKSLKRNLCEFPTEQGAKTAGMSLEEYANFIFNACKLNEKVPSDAWLEVRYFQQKIVDFLNKKSTMRYKNENFDLTFSVKDRTWINSDGRNNMPSGEVFTSPVEDSVNGVIHFSFPAVYGGNEVEDVTLWVKDGWIEKWEAKKGKAFLDEIFKIKGTRRFGEAAIGTNYQINRLTKNILFDEKIGGSVHLAIGQSYLQCGGKNESTVHWDMITDMTKGGQIYADNEKIYENGQFLIV